MSKLNKLLSIDLINTFSHTFYSEVTFFSFIIFFSFTFLSFLFAQH